ncbi:MAG: polysaccharide biosynthesis tyrosine autokinase [Curtobacterium sp.]
MRTPTLQLRDYVRVLRRHVVLIVATLVLGLVAGAGFSFLQTPVYQSTSKVFVGLNSVSTVQELNAGSTFVQQAVASYANLVTTDSVLEPVINRLDLPTTPNALAGQITATTPLNTVVIDITVSDTSPQRAAAIANAVASQLSTSVDSLTPSAGKQNAVAVSKVDSAVAPSSPTTPRIPLNISLGGLVGLALGLVLAFLHERLDSRIRGQRDIELVTDRPVLGGITYDPRAAREPLIVRDDPRSVHAEAFRSLRTNLQFLDFGGASRAFVVTSAVENEGKSTTAANLAIAEADAGRRVLLVEADLRKPKVAEYLGLPSGAGLTDVLIGEVPLDEAVQSWGDRGMQVLAAGRIPPNPSELLQSGAMVDLIGAMRERFDTVIFDAPPLLPVSDAAILAHATSGAVMVAAAGRTNRLELRAALGAVHQIDAKVLGIVLTMLPTRGADAYAFGRYGYASAYGVAAAHTSTARDVSAKSVELTSQQQPRHA